MLAYVFWHIPREGADPEAYEEKLTAFHDSLVGDPPAGFRASTVFRHYALPWAPSSMFVYEDWYLVESFAALGSLNEAAVADGRKQAHDEAARHSSWGAGGVYRPLGEAASLVGGFSYWMSKPDGMGYEAFYEDVGSPAARTLWRRQMVLGPAPEFCVLSETRLELAALDPFESSARTVYESSSGS